VVIGVSDPHVVDELVARIATESEVIAQISDGTERLRSIERAKRELARFAPETIRAALTRRRVRRPR
jgi:hypothetical protein